MANILLTNKCVRACPYCFAGQEMAQASAFLSWENVVYLADFLLASAHSRVSLLGGEPTLHPQFTDILVYLLERGFTVTVFTSGIMSKTALTELAAHVAALPPERLNFVCNLNNPAQTDTLKSETHKLHDFLAALGPRTMPAFNIYRSDFDIGFIFELVARFAMKKRLRLGIAHPIPGAANEAITVADIGAVIERLCSFRAAFEQSRVRPSFDCGFPLCRITDAELGWLVRLTGRADFKCTPAIDITPDMQVYCCFPLSSLNRRSIYDFDSFNAVVAYYRSLQERIRGDIAGIYAECGACVHRAERTCAGGGVCQLVNRLTNENPARLRTIENEHQACLPQ
ncbi:MAG: radical SAM protein [Alphaproteobacteria bacterium]|nr:radical SAM protein [Alphaproteobacteria bacterium]